MIQRTTKQDYQKAEFMGAIVYNQPPRPFKVFFKETLDKQIEADQILKRMQAEERPRLVAKFNLLKKQKTVSISPILRLNY